MRRPLILFSFVLLWNITNPGVFAKSGPGVNPALYKALEWRSMGPYRGGRATTVTGVPSKPHVYYMGASGGGVWKTENSGHTWNNISDEFFKTGSVGAVAVSLSDPNVVYVGMGESPIRNQTSSHGDGVYKSTDAGKSWNHLGLEGTRQISKIRIHPTNPDIVYVAAQGNPWGASEERGVYRSKDGGITWELILKTNAESGASDLSMDANNPRILYAAMWDHGRKPWFVRSGGPGGGVYKTTDSGDTWKKLKNGLPEFVGKIGIAVSPANSDRVYAIIEAEKGGLYRSDNSGASWQRINSARIGHARAWYYIHITADTEDEDIVYVLNVMLLKSIDGGRTYTSMSAPHGDHHDLWIHPINNKIMICADDGGAAVTFDSGKNWSRQNNQPTGQFYRVVTDNRFPYHLYGAQQDNEAIGMSSQSDGSDFYSVNGWERSQIAFDPDNPRLIYSTSNHLSLTEFDRETDRTRSLKLYPQYLFGLDTKKHKYRAAWHPPVALSPHDPGIIYYGTNKLMRSNDRGHTWMEISPDLTTNNETQQGKMGGPITNELDADAYNTIFYIVESSHEAGTIWVGSDDGLVHLTRDGGKNWKNVTPSGVGEAFINAIEVSPHDPAKVYIAVDGHRSNDFTPSIYKTENYGRKWHKIVNGLPEDTFIRVVREDPEQPGLLYAGMESGVSVSFNDGSDWQSLQLNLPKVPVTDLKLRQGDLVASTEGRGFWILANPAPLRQLKASLENADLHVFEPVDAYRTSNGGAVIYYYLKDDPGKDAGKATFEILDNSGQIVRTVKTDPERKKCMDSNSDIGRPFRRAKDIRVGKGLNRWAWNLRRDGFRCIDNMRLFAGLQGARVIPGDYQVRVTVGEYSQTRSFKVVPDPREDIPAAQFAELDAHLTKTASILSSLITRLDRLRMARDQVVTLAGLTEGHAHHQDIKAGADAIVARIAEWEVKVTQPKHETVEDEINYPNMLDAQFMYLLQSSDRMDAPVSAGASARLVDLNAEWDVLVKEYESITKEDIAAFNRLLRKEGIGPVVVRRDL
ncbi:MAG: glycosyl hydrolase [Deltaproteobacteria bacterium]|nr:glycosyl hydrolase [Deltaproteobacteria bacterium]